MKKLAPDSINRLTSHSILNLRKKLVEGSVTR